MHETSYILQNNHEKIFKKGQFEIFDDVFFDVAAVDIKFAIATSH